jgi:hypothetical protein
MVPETKPERRAVPAVIVAHPVAAMEPGHGIGGFGAAAGQLAWQWRILDENEPLASVLRF